MVPAPCVFQPVGEIEVQQADGVDGVEVEIPVASALRLFADGERGVVDGAVLEELLVDILHLDNELLALVVLTVDVEHGAAGVHPVTELLGVQIGDFLHVLLAAEHGVEEAFQEFFVEFPAKQSLEAEVGMWV